MATRLILFTPREIASILQQHIGIPGQCEMFPTLNNTPIAMTVDDELLKGFSTVFSGVRLVIEDTPLPPEEKLRKLIG